MKNHLVKTTCWTMGGISSLLFVGYLIPSLSYISEEPFPVLICLVAALLAPMIPFASLILHFNARAQNDNPPSATVSSSILFAAVVTFVVTVAIFLFAILPYDYGVIIIFVMPMVTLPVMVIVCFLAWIIANRIIKKTEPSSAPIPNKAQK